MAKHQGLCYLLIVVVAIIFMVMGFMDALGKARSDDLNANVTISRQLRGFALLMLAQVVVIVGGALCFGLSQNGIAVM